MGEHETMTADLVYGLKIHSHPLEIGSVEREVRILGYMTKGKTFW